MCLNVCGLGTKLKYGILDKYISDYDIISLCETKTDHIDYEDFPGYTVFCLQKKKSQPYRYGGIHGICILVKDVFAASTSIIQNTSSENILWIYVNNNVLNIELIIGSVYIPHENSVYYQSDIFDKIAEDLIEISTKYDSPVILMGDFNARTSLKDDFISLNDSISILTGLENISNDLFNSKKNLMLLDLPTRRSNVDSGCNNNGNKLIDLCKDLDMKIVNGRFGPDKNVGNFTCYKPNGNSVVDYIITSPELFPKIVDFQIDVFDSCLSDVHCPLSITLNLSAKHLSANNETKPISIPDNSDSIFEYVPLRTNWDNERAIEYTNEFDIGKTCKLLEALNNVDNSSLLQDDIDRHVQEFCQLCIMPGKCIGFTKEYPNKEQKKVKENNKPWFNRDCDSERKAYIKIKNKLKSVKTDEAKIQSKIAAKCYKRFIKKVRKTYYKKLHGELRNLKQHQSKEYWNKLNKASGNKVKEGNIPIESYVKHFQQLGENSTLSVRDQVKFNPENLLNDYNNEYINNSFTEKEITDVIKKLRNNKSCGIDNVVNEFLKNCPNIAICVIVKLFNIVLETGIVPSSWCIGIIKPIFKNKGSIDDPDNYRGITLLSCLGKLFTSVINSRLVDFIECTGLLGEEQAGFREGYSTSDHIFVLSSIIELYLSRHKRLYCAFIDYKKAFDLVDRSSLWSKLLSNGINGKILQVVYNMYDQAKSCVKKGQTLSKLFACQVGVRQGENLSPLLFAIYLNDFEYHVSRKYKGLSALSDDFRNYLSDDDVEVFFKMYVLLYADDTIVMAESPEELQDALDAVHNFCSFWHLTVNTTKTKVVIFSSGKVRNHPDFIYNDNILEVVNDYTYLGVTINYNGLFNKAVSKQIDQARRAMYGLISKARKLQLPIDIQCELFNQIVLPILLYGSEVWGFHNLNYIEIFHRKFLKQILKLHKGTPNCMVYGESGHINIYYIVYQRMINYWIRIINGKHSKLSNIMLRLMYNMYKNNAYQFKWLCKIKYILDQCGYSNMFLEIPLQSVNLRWFKLSFERKIKDISTQNWQADVFSNSICTNYRLFKCNHHFEKYISILDESTRIPLTKFRCGNHRLPISNNRFFSEHSILCKACNTIGDEYHYILKCPLFNSDRQKLVEKKYYTNPNTLKFNELFNNENSHELHKLSKFVRIIMSKF